MLSVKVLGRRSCMPLLGGKKNGWLIDHGRRHAKPLFSLIGIGEIILLPLDVLKIKRQTNPEAFRGRGVFRIVADEGMGLYRGAGWTAARNAPGSFAVSPMLCHRISSSSCSASKVTSTEPFLAVRRFRLRQGVNL